MSLETVDKEYIGQVLLNKGFRTWFLYMFRMVEGTPFILEPLHDDLLQVFDDIYNQYTKRINLNLPPRSAKTSLCAYFVAFCLAKNPKCNFIYTSYSQLLLGDVSRRITAILEHPVYKAMYPVGFTAEEEQSQPISDFWLEYLRKETGKNTYTQKKIVTYAGGVVYFSAIGSQITGFGAAIRGAKGFTGAVVCFPYDETVFTENGLVKIGELVENKKDFKVYSLNHKTGKIELKKIEKFIKNNKKSYFVKIKLSNGEKIECTSDHKIYTQNRGYIEAQYLSDRDIICTFSNSFNLMNCQIKFLHKFFPRIIPVANFIYNLVSKSFCFSRRIINIARKTFKRLTGFYITNSRSACMETAGDIANSFFGLRYLFNIISCKFRARKHQSTKFYSVLHIVRFCAVSKIYKPIIRWIRIKMSDFNSYFLFTHKSPQNKLMYSKSSCFSIFTQINNLITFSIRRIKFFFFQRNQTSFRATSCIHKTRTTYYIAKIRNLIKTLITGNIFINDVCVIYQNETSYCLTVQDNHNLFVGKKQGVLVSNCDDANKPADVYSQRMRDNVLRYFEETLLSRLNNSDAAIINVQQRLHVEDLSGHLKAKYGFDELVKPLLVNDVCQLPKQYTPERIAELKRNQYMFSAQYQQHPIILGGQVFHRDWWRFYAVLPEFEYCFMTADTAMKIKQANDFSVFCLWGVTRETNDLYLVDMIRGKWEAPDLERQFLNFWAKWQGGVNHTRVRAVYIEDKASGTGLIQSIKRKGNVPIRGYIPEKDKLQRAYDATPFIEGGRVYLPQNENFAISKQMVDECEAFTTDDSHLHDDCCDNVSMAIDIAYRKQPMRINPDVLL